MHDILYVLIGVLGTGAVLFLSKMFGGKKGKTVPAVDTEKATQAMDKATELLGRRAMVEAKAEEDRKRIEDKLSIEDPAERLDAIADELRDL
jgi:hypothetical protein